MVIKSNVGVWLLIVVAGFAGTAHAGITTYSDLASFQAASAGLTMTTIEFEGIVSAPNQSVVYPASENLSFSGVTFTSPRNLNLIVVGETHYADHSLSPIYYSLGSGAFLQTAEDAPASLNIALPSNVTAAGFFLNTFDSIASAVAVTLSTGDSFIVSAPYPTPVFVGFTSPIAFSSINLTVTGGNLRSVLTIDSFAFESAGSVPEPGALSMMILGAGGLAFMARRRRA